MHATTTRRLAAVVTAALALAAIAPATSSAAKSKSARAGEQLTGNWMSEVPCGPTGTDFYDPISQDFNCTGVSLWTGTWSGPAIYRAWGKLDPITGKASGYVEERWIGTTPDGHTGQLHFIETVEITGTAAPSTITAKILDGSGDFEGATGKAVFKGTSILSSGAGSYTGYWTHPKY